MVDLPRARENSVAAKVTGAWREQVRSTEVGCPLVKGSAGDLQDPFIYGHRDFHLDKQGDNGEGADLDSDLQEPSAGSRPKTGLLPHSRLGFICKCTVLLGT